MTEPSNYKHGLEETITLARDGDEISVWPSDEVPGSVDIALMDSDDPRTNVGVATPAAALVKHATPLPPNMRRKSSGWANANSTYARPTALNRAIAGSSLAPVFVARSIAFSIRLANCSSPPAAAAVSSSKR